MAPLSKAAPQDPQGPRNTIFATDISPLPNLLHNAVERLLKRDLGPSQAQSVGMAVGLSIAGIVVAIFVFGWVRYIAARGHQRAAEQARAEKAEEALAS